jgi:hydroxymethylglutaryl-CoA lyase
MRENKVIITDVTLREYGQNVPASHMHIFTPEIRIGTAKMLADAGFRNMEVLSCIHPGIAPAMDEQALKAVSRGMGRIDGVRIITLVPNQAGYRSFLSLELGPDGFNHTLGMFFSAVESHNMANLGRPIKETLDEYRSIARDAAARGIRMVGYVSAALGYMEPGKGLVRADTGEVCDYIDALLDMGAETVTLSDLQGVADEKETERFFSSLLNMRGAGDRERLGYHPHHVEGERGVANSRVAYDLGIRRFDSSLGGTGGCVTGAPGNQPTELLVSMFHDSSISTGLDAKKILSLNEFVNRELYHRIPMDG